MGQQANDAAKGLVCSHCGVWFVEPHEFPVLCEDCYDGEFPDARDGLPRATIPELEFLGREVPGGT